MLTLVVARNVPTTWRVAEGEVVAIPTLPADAIVNLLVAVENPLPPAAPPLNLNALSVSNPKDQPQFVPLSAANHALEAAATDWAITADRAVTRPFTSRELTGELVLIPILPPVVKILPIVLLVPVAEILVVTRKVPLVIVVTLALLICIDADVIPDDKFKVADEILVATSVEAVRVVILALVICAEADVIPVDKINVADEILVVVALVASNVLVVIPVDKFNVADEIFVEISWPVLILVVARSVPAT